MAGQQQSEVNRKGPAYADGRSATLQSRVIYPYNAF